MSMPIRLYAQLQPDKIGLEHLKDIQKSVYERGRLVPTEQLHLTLIHFGIVDEIIKSLPMTPDNVSVEVNTYITRSKQILETFPVKCFKLRPLGLDKFGENKRTLVIKYETTDELVEVHKLLLDALKDFFVDCGVVEVEKFMKSDINFKHALTISPHVTICKGFDGELPRVELKTIELETMKFVY